MGDVMTTTQRPSYCRVCNPARDNEYNKRREIRDMGKLCDTFERYPQGDILSESGKTMWERWKCKKCGNTALFPVVVSQNKSVGVN